MIDKWGRIIVLRTSFVEILIINTYTDGTLFLSSEYDVRDPFGQKYRIDKINFEEFFDFGFNRGYLFSMNWPKSLSNRMRSSNVLISCTTIRGSMPDISSYDQAKMSWNS